MAEDVIVDPVLVAGVADADAHAAEIGADMRLGREQAVMPGSAAALLHLDLEGREIELVVEDGDVGGREPVDRKRGGEGKSVSRRVEIGGCRSNDTNRERTVTKRCMVT